MPNQGLIRGADLSNVLETRGPLHSSEATRNPAKIATP